MLWDDLDARARGLSTRLLGRPRLEALARADDLPSLAAELERAGYGPLPPAGRAGAAALEIALARGAAARLRLLARWAGPRSKVFAALLEEEDRRSLRALLRGAAAGAPPEARLAGLLPTPELPERALAELARQPTPAAVTALLAAWGSPWGPALAEEAGRPHPDLFRLERALARTAAARALAASRPAGRELTRWVREGIDLDNAAAAVLLAGSGTDVEPAASYLPGGLLLDEAGFLAAAAARDRGAAGRRLAAAFRGTPFAAVFARLLPQGPEGPEAGELEPRLLAARLRRQVEAARHRPLGPAPLLVYLLRLRAELLDLRRLVWGIALGAPRQDLVGGLVS